MIWVLGALGLAFMAFIIWLVRRSQKAGEDSLYARQVRAAEKGKQRVTEAQNRANSMSDDGVRERLRDKWTRSP